MEEIKIENEYKDYLDSMFYSKYYDDYGSSYYETYESLDYNDIKEAGYKLEKKIIEYNVMSYIEFKISKGYEKVI